jgi:hypothetical protein
MSRRLGGPHGRFRWARKISPPTGIRFPLRPAFSESSHLSDHTEENKGIWQKLATLVHCRVIFVAVRMFTHDASGISRGTVSLRLSSNGCQPILHSHRYRLFRPTEHFYCCVEKLHVWIENDHRQAFFYKILKFEVKYFWEISQILQRACYNNIVASYGIKCRQTVMRLLWYSLKFSEDLFIKMQLKINS